MSSGDSINFKRAVSTGKYGAWEPKTIRSMGTRAEGNPVIEPIIRPTAPFPSRREISMTVLVFDSGVASRCLCRQWLMAGERNSGRGQDRVFEKLTASDGVHKRSILDGRDQFST